MEAKALIINSSMKESMLILNYLRENKYEVYIQKSLRELKRLLNYYDFDLVFLEIMNFDIMGLDTIAFLKENFPETTIIAMDCDQVYLDLSRAQGAHYTLEKPLDFYNIQNVLNSIKYENVPNVYSIK